MTLITVLWRTWPRSVFSKVRHVRQTSITHLLPFDWLWNKTFRILLISCIRRYIESNTGKSARQGNLRHPRVRFQSFADEAREILPVFDFISHFYQLFLVSCLFVNSASCKQCELFPLHVNQNSSSVFLCIAGRLLCNNMVDC